MEIRLHNLKDRLIFAKLRSLFQEDKSNGQFNDYEVV